MTRYRVLAWRNDYLPCILVWVEPWAITTGSGYYTYRMPYR